jgi:hypothetical protein
MTDSSMIRIEFSRRLPGSRFIILMIVQQNLLS